MTNCLPLFPHVENSLILHLSSLLNHTHPCSYAKSLRKLILNSCRSAECRDVAGDLLVALVQHHGRGDPTPVSVSAAVQPVRVVVQAVRTVDTVTGNVCECEWEAAVLANRLWRPMCVDLWFDCRSLKRHSVTTRSCRAFCNCAACGAPSYSKQCKRNVRALEHRWKFQRISSNAHQSSSHPECVSDREYSHQSQGICVRGM